MLIPHDLAVRVRLIRAELYGDDGIDELAEAMGLPAATWRNYEDGVIIPAIVILRFLVVTKAKTSWLMTGEGDRYWPSLQMATKIYRYIRTF